jgi:hypothetical protein
MTEPAKKRLLRDFQQIQVKTKIEVPEDAFSEK